MILDHHLVVHFWLAVSHSTRHMQDSIKSTSDAYRYATPFRKLGIPAYIALAVIIVLVTGVFVYAICRCYQSARFEASHEHHKAAYTTSSPAHTTIWTDLATRSALRKKSLKVFQMLPTWCITKGSHCTAISLAQHSMGHGHASSNLRITYAFASSTSVLHSRRRHPISLDLHILPLLVLLWVVDQNQRTIRREQHTVCSSNK